MIDTLPQTEWFRLWKPSSWNFQNSEIGGAKGLIFRGQWAAQARFCRGHYTTPTQTMHYFGGIPQNYHTFALFDSLPNGSHWIILFPKVRDSLLHGLAILTAAPISHLTKENPLFLAPCWWNYSWRFMQVRKSQRSAKVVDLLWRRKIVQQNSWESEGNPPQCHPPPRKQGLISRLLRQGQLKKNAVVFQEKVNIHSKKSSHHEKNLHVYALHRFSNMPLKPTCWKFHAKIHCHNLLCRKKLTC